MKNYTITVNGTAYEVCVEEAGAVAAAPKADLVSSLAVVLLSRP